LRILHIIFKPLHYAKITTVSILSKIILFTCNTQLLQNTVLLPNKKVQLAFFLPHAPAATEQLDKQRWFGSPRKVAVTNNYNKTSTKVK
jgi:hypothetical protein